MRDTVSRRYNQMSEQLAPPSALPRPRPRPRPRALKGCFLGTSLACETYYKNMQNVTYHIDYMLKC